MRFLRLRLRLSLPTPTATPGAFNCLAGNLSRAIADAQKVLPSRSLSYRRISNIYSRKIGEFPRTAIINGSYASHRKHKLDYSHLIPLKSP